MSDTDRATIQQRKATKAREWLRRQYEKTREAMHGNLWIFAGVTVEMLPDPRIPEADPIDKFDLLTLTEAQLARWWSDAVQMVSLAEYDLDQAMEACKPGEK